MYKKINYSNNITLKISCKLYNLNKEQMVNMLIFFKNLHESKIIDIYTACSLFYNQYIL